MWETVLQGLTLWARSCRRRGRLKSWARGRPVQAWVTPTRMRVHETMEGLQGPRQTQQEGWEKVLEEAGQAQMCLRRMGLRANPSLFHLRSRIPRL